MAAQRVKGVIPSVQTLRKFLRRHSSLILLLAVCAVPSSAHAATVDLKQISESGNAIFMYVLGTFAAIGIAVAGIAMMSGRPAIAKWAIVGALICGLAFPIVRTIWSSAGMESSDVGTFSP